MKCRECQTTISYQEHADSLKALGIPLCAKHLGLFQQVMNSFDTPIEALHLYFALKDCGANPMLEWWDGKRSVDIAISRVKLNIDIGTDYEMMTHEQALTELEAAMISYKNGFTNIRIPHVLVKYHLTIR